MSEFSLKQINLDESEISFLVQIFVFVVAKSLVRNSITKKELRGVRASEFGSSLPKLAKQFMGARTQIMREIRKLVRIGPEQYMKDLGKIVGG